MGRVPNGPSEEGMPGGFLPLPDSGGGGGAPKSAGSTLRPWPPQLSPEGPNGPVATSRRAGGPVGPEAARAEGGAEPPRLPCFTDSYWRV